MVAEEPKDELSSQEVLKIDRYLWIARAFAGVAVLSFVANVLIFVALGALYPLVRVQPFYLTALDKNQQIVEILPAKAEELRSERVEESLVRQYIMARYTVTDNHDELKERWGTEGIVFLMSSQEVYGAFEDIVVEPVLDAIEKDNLTVNVRIISPLRDPPQESSSKWSTKVLLTKMTQSSNMPVEECRSEQLVVQYDPLYERANRINWEDRLKNPLGFRVLQYSTSHADIQDCKQEFEG